MSAERIMAAAIIILDASTLQVVFIVGTVFLDSLEVSQPDVE